jgi:hypothetical protein
LGYVPVEDLKIGPLLRTLSGQSLPIVRVVKQKLIGYFLTKDQSPVCLHAGALGQGIPMLGLYVSACHSVKVNEYLVDARLLVNGVTITQ